MAFPPMEPFTIPATHTVPVFAAELEGSRVSEVCAVHVGSNHDQHPGVTSHDNEPGHAARLWRGLKPVPSIDKASTPGIAVVRDSLVSY